MARGPRYRVPYRRRREKKTDYAARRVLATSGYPRFVVRISNKNILVQLARSEIDGDYILTQASSSELADKYDWQASGKNTPAAYLLGLMAGKKALKAGVEAAHLDLGLKRPTSGSKVFAAVKGANDAGLEVPCDSDVMPSPERINGTTVAEYAENMEDPLKYEERFSVYLRKGLRPEALPSHFEEVKARILEEQD